MTMVPLPYRVTARRQETADTATLTLEPVGAPMTPPAPGQFSMVYAFGVGEVPISVSGSTGTGQIVHTLRAVGAVTRALHNAPVGAVLGLRGPFGTTWGLPAPAGADLVIVGGGIGLAPLRPVVRHALDRRERYRRVVVLVGARTPADLLYADSYDAWRAGGADVRVTVDRDDPGWTGHVGVVTTLMADLGVDPFDTVAFVCGPEVMMRFAARRLMSLGVPAARVRVSLERNMRCGVALCGHCQLGGLLVCRDGPVVGYDAAEPLMMVKEL
jgi:anaerobic sulfite reductase subunit B